MALRIHLSIFLPLTFFVPMGVFLVAWCAQKVGASTLCYEAFTYLHKHVVYETLFVLLCMSYFTFSLLLNCK